MISAAVIRMPCNGIRISLKSEKYNQRNRVCHGVHDTPFSFLHFFHRISRMNREAFLLIGFLTEFRGTLAAGQWLAPDICSCFFCHADFADDADFSLWGLFRPTDFTDDADFSLCGLFRPTNFTDDTDFSLCGLFCHADFADDADFSLWRLFRPTDFSLWDFFQPQGVSAPTGQVASVKIRE